MNNLLTLFLSNLLMGLVCILLPNATTIRLKTIQYWHDDKDELCWQPKYRKKFLIKSIVVTITYGIFAFLYQWLISDNHELHSLFGYGLFGVIIAILSAFDLDYLSRLWPHLFIFIFFAVCVLIF